MQTHLVFVLMTYEEEMHPLVLLSDGQHRIHSNVSQRAPSRSHRSCDPDQIDAQILANPIWFFCDWGDLMSISSGHDEIRYEEVERRYEPEESRQ